MSFYSKAIFPSSWTALPLNLPKEGWALLCHEARDSAKTTASYSTLFPLSHQTFLFPVARSKHIPQLHPIPIAGQDCSVQQVPSTFWNYGFHGKDGSLQCCLGPKSPGKMQHQRYSSRYRHWKTPPQAAQVCGNPAVTHTPYLHTPFSFLSCFLCLFQNDSINSSHSSKSKCCLVKLYGRTWSHTRHLHSKALVTIVLTPEKQCFTCRITKCQIHLCLSKSFLIRPSDAWNEARFALACAADDR